MGMRGPAPKPAPNESAVQAIKGEMTPPDWIREDAARHWDSILPMLREMGIESPIYNPALAMLCNSFGRYLQFEKELDESGASSISGQGTASVSPQLKNRNAAAEEVRKMLREFGLTPMALSSVRKARPTKESTSKQEKGILGIISPKLVG